MPDRLHRRVREFRKCNAHDGAKDPPGTEQRHNHAAIRPRLPGDVQLRLEFIRHELVPTSLQNSDNTGCLSLCDHHIPAGRGIKIESGWAGLRKCDRPDPPTTKTHVRPFACPSAPRLLAWKFRTSSG